MSAKSGLLAFGRALPVAALGVGLVGLFRLGRQFPAAAASPGLLVPFLKPVLALALEAGALVALSVSVLLVLRQARLDSFSARARSAAPLLGVLALTLAAAALVPRGTERPGVLANDLISRARGGCGSSVASVPIPLLGLTMRCGDAPRIEGPMPGVASVELGMRELTFSDDLRRVTISGLELSAKRALKLHLTAGSATIAGLAPWSRSSRLSTLVRFLMLAALGASLWLAATLGWRSASAAPAAESPAPVSARVRALRRLGQLLLCASPGMAAAALVIWLDQQRAGPLLYALAAAAGVVVLLALRLLARRGPKLFSSFSNF